MKTINKFAFALAAIAALLFLPPASAQVATPATNTILSTTFSSAVNQFQSTVTVGSVTGMVIGDVLFSDMESMVVGKTWNGTSTTVPVSRYQGKNGAHVSGAIVLYGRPKWFNTYDPTGACPTPPTAGGTTPTNVFTTPWLNTMTGSSFRCYAGQWGKTGSFFVSPYNCSFIPTTLTQTTTFPVVGLGTGLQIPVINSVTSAAAGTDTLTCFINVPADVASGRSNLLTDITLSLGSQVVAPTSLGTSTLASVTFPTPVATTQTPSVVTPVASAGGTVTQLGPTTTVLSVTTAGAFLTFNYAYSAPVDLTTDLRTLVFSLPILQSAASAMTVNSAGLFVHYIHRQ